MRFGPVLSKERRHPLSFQLMKSDPIRASGCETGERTEMQVDVLTILLKEGVNDCEMDVGLSVLFTVDISYRSLRALLVGPSGGKRRNPVMGGLTL